LERVRVLGVCMKRPLGLQTCEVKLAYGSVQERSLESPVRSDSESFLKV